DARHIRVVGTIDRRVEAKAAGIDLVAGAQVVRRGITAGDEVQEIGINTNAGRVERSNRVWPADWRLADALRRRCERAELIASRPIVDVIEQPVADIVQRNDTQLLMLACVAAPFVIEEEKQFVALYRPAQASAELVAYQCRPVNAILVVEERV